MLRPSVSSAVVILLSLLSAMIVTVIPQDAAACSCRPAPLERTTTQFDGVEDFPTDGVLRVFLTGGFTGYSAALRRALADEYRLIDESGEVIALEFVDVVRTRLDMRPVSTLEPDTEYTVERLFAYNEHGQPLDDQSRWDSNDLRQSPRRGGDDDPLRYAWSADTSFRTADDAVERPEIQPQVTQSRMSFAYGGGDCGPGISVSADFELPEGVQPTDVIELEIQGQGVGDTNPAFGNGPLSHLRAGDMLCNPDKVTVDYSPSLQVRVLIRDASDEIVGSSDWVTAEESSRRGFIEALHDRPRASDDKVEFDEELWQEPSMLDVEAEDADEEATRPDPVWTSCLTGIEADSVLQTILIMIERCMGDESGRAD